MNIILIGFMATGKSTIGRALARQIDSPLLDMDRELEKRFEMPISEFFSTVGEDEFRKHELALLTTLHDEMTLDPANRHDFPRRYVLSTGGGVPLRAENRELLRKLGHVVWLKASVKTISDRTRPKLEKRPILAGHEADLENHIHNLLKIRIPAYEACAHSTIWTDDRITAEQIASRIRNTIHRNTQQPSNKKPSHITKPVIE